MFDHNETLQEARERNVRDALFEDVGVCDWTAQLVPANQRVKARLLVREEAVLCGRDWFEGCLLGLDPSASLTWTYDEGALMAPGTEVCALQADARALLTAERPGLNFLQTLSAVATLTREHMQAIEGASPNPKGCVVLDTRKTLPGLRLAQKYAVRVGGGANQRLALYDGILIKENHIAAAGSVTAAVKTAQALVAAQASPLREQITIQVEVETLAQLREALQAGAVSVLLDNFSPQMMRDAVAINQEVADGVALLEVSGGVTLDQLRGIAETGPYAWTGVVKSLKQQMQISTESTMRGEPMTDEQAADLDPRPFGLEPQRILRLDVCGYQRRCGITECLDALPPDTSIVRPAPKSWKAMTFPQSRPSRSNAASPIRSASDHSRSPVSGRRSRST